MLDTDDPALWYALNRLTANYWADVDDEGGSHAHEFYVPEEVYTVGDNRFRRSGQDPRVLCQAPPARDDHHASPRQQPPSIPRRRATHPGDRGDEPLSRRWPSAD